MNDFIKKVFVLLILFLLVFVVYLLKNPDTRDRFLAKINVFDSGNIKISEDIEIEEEDINMDNLVKNVGAIQESPDENIEPELPDTKTELPDGVEAVRESPNLENIEKQVAEISEKVEKIEKEIKILLAMKEIQKEINQLTEKAENLTVVNSI